MKIGPGDQTTTLQNLASNSRPASQAPLSKAYNDVEARKGSKLADIDSVNSVKDAEKWVGKLNDTKLSEFKDAVKDVDFTAITQKQLVEIGASLFKQGLIGEETLSKFVVALEKKIYMEKRIFGNK